MELENGIMSLQDIESAVRDIPDFPKPGIIFKDITPILGDPALFEETVTLLAAPWRDAGLKAVAAIDARGFIFGGAVARELGIGLIPVRKKGKLPWHTFAVEYELEYGTNCVEMHTDACLEGDKVLVLDDLLATGGTAKAAIELIEKTGAKVAGVQFVLELDFLHGRKKFAGYPVKTLFHVD
jgi:adenine phosphoribosyltransferase